MSRKRSNHCHPTATAPYTALDFLTHKMPNSTVTVPDFPAQKVPDSISLLDGIGTGADNQWGKQCDRHLCRLISGEIRKGLKQWEAGEEVRGGVRFYGRRVLKGGTRWWMPQGCLLRCCAPIPSVGRSLTAVKEM